MQIASVARQFLLLSAGAILLNLRLADVAEAHITIYHPGDGFASIQAAVDAAGCDGTVLVATGVYNERVLAHCGIKLIGAGINETIIDGTGLDLTILPVVGLGNNPFAQFPFTGPYELANLTVRVEPSNIRVLGVAVAWTRKSALHDLSIEGFSDGVYIELSIDTVIENVLVEGNESSGFLSVVCIWFLERNLFRDLLPTGHMSGHVMHDSSLRNCGFGFVVDNTINAAIHHNTVDSRNGFLLRGVGKSEVHGNTIKGQSGLQNLNDSTIHNNRVCTARTIPGILFITSQTPDLFGFPPSSDNAVHHNAFGPGIGSVFIDDPNIGPDNRIYKNEYTNAQCPL